MAEVFLAGRRGRGMHAGPVPLSERERAVLQWLGQGRTEKEVARAEGVSRRTVTRIVATLEVKLEAPTLFVLGQRARQLGLVD